MLKPSLMYDQSAIANSASPPRIDVSPPTNVASSLASVA